MPHIQIDLQTLHSSSLAHSPGCAPTTTGWETIQPISDSDIAVEGTLAPAHCVDYLTHNWTDEDLASSWRVVSRHSNVSSNCSRLENASWRIWAKRRNNIPTLNPAELNWHKDNDTSWLYGPLLQPSKPTFNSAPVSKSSSFLGSVSSLGLKPALKKRTSFQQLRQSTAPLPRPESKRDIKLRFNSQVEQFVAVESPESVSPICSRRSSVVQVASTTIKYAKPQQTHSFEDDEEDEFSPYSNLYRYNSSNIPDLPLRAPPPPPPSFPIVQSCVNVISTTFGVISWARSMIF